MDDRPIGIFDSGVGGLTVADKIFTLLPDEHIIYVGDTARVPYGNKSKEAVTRFSKEIARFLLSFKVKLIIVACNTASSLSLPALKKMCRVPVIGVIKPGVTEALEASFSGRIGVIGTEATISSGAYRGEIKALKKSAFVIQKSCPLFVPLAENMHFNDGIALQAARMYLRPVVKAGIDSLILGCTHYPLLKRAIRKVAGRRVFLVDSSMAVAKYARRLLKKKKLLARSGRKKMRFFATDDTKSFAKLAKAFLGRTIKAEKAVL